MILIPNKTKALEVSRSRTVNRIRGGLVLSRVSICAGLNIDILGVKFDSMLKFEENVGGIVSRVSQRLVSLKDTRCFEVGEVCLCGHLCVASLPLCICSPNP